MAVGLALFVMIPSLQAQTPPVITSQPTSQAVPRGLSASFRVNSTGSQPLTYQWQMQGANLTDDGRISGAQTRILTLRNVQPADEGGYAVVVANAYGSATWLVGCVRRIRGGTTNSATALVTAPLALATTTA